MSARIHAEARPANASTAAATATATAGEPSQYLTFMLGGEIFAMGILAIREIIEYGSLTLVPMMPECIRGVINLRGSMVPVMDLSVRFGRKATEVTKRTCIVIVEVNADGNRQVMGVVVDAVNAVLDIPPEDIESAPTFSNQLRTDFIQGMGKINGRFVILVNTNTALSVKDMGISTQEHASSH